MRITTYQITDLESLAERLADINPNWGFDHMGGGVMCIQRIDPEVQYLISECEDDLTQLRFALGTYPAVKGISHEVEYSMDGHELQCCLTADDIIKMAYAIDTERSQS